MQLDDIWLAVWDQGTHDEEQLPYLLCPHHARNKQVPRPEASRLVGDVEVNLQEFDCIGTRPPDIAMFKRGGRVVWCVYETSVSFGVVDRHDEQERAPTLEREQKLEQEHSRGRGRGR